MLLVNALGWGIVAKLDFMYVMAPKVTVIQPSKAFWYFSLEVLIICEIVAGVNGKGISNLRRVCPPHTSSRLHLPSMGALSQNRVSLEVGVNPSESTRTCSTNSA
jgi:hypothetical protein